MGPWPCRSDVTNILLLDNWDRASNIDLELSFNEFYDYNDHFGLFEQEIEPHNFLTLDDYTTTLITMTGLGDKTYPNSTINLPQLEIKFRLSDNKILLER